MKKADLDNFLKSINLNEFILFFKTHGTKLILDTYKLKSYNDLKQVKKALNIELTKQELSFKNAVAVREACQLKYGVDNPWQLESTKTKIKNTCLERYGTTNGGWTSEAQRKIKETNQQKFKVDSVLQLPRVRERAKEVCKSKYGVEYFTQAKEIQNKIVKTSLKKYGTTRPQKNNDVKAKTKLTCLLKYEGVGPQSNREVRKKTIQTCYKKYKVLNYFQSSEFRSKARKLYVYDGCTFDSLPELAVYVFYKDLGIKIIRNTSISFEFLYKDKPHYYFPDFVIEDRLVEIKGDHFFRDNGTMRNPYDHALDELYEAKHRCGLRNKVEFWKSSECKNFIDYFKNNYCIINGKVVKRSVKI